MLTDWEPRVRETIARFLRNGELPTAARINQAMGWNGGDAINGRVTRVRTEMLRAAGYRLYFSPGYARRWVAPSQTAPEGWVEIFD